jgi:alkylation response protein AidB-like acyl-CoA dehydrogenase
VTGPFAESDDEFLASARSALRSASPNDALTTLEWPELLPYLEETEARRAVFALFRAQGRDLTTTGALGALMASPYAGVDPSTGPVTAALVRHSPRRGPGLVVIGRPAAGVIVVDRPGEGARLVAVADNNFRPLLLPGKLELHEVELDGCPTVVSIPEEEAFAYRGRSLFLGRVALAFEMLGAAEGAIALAVEHAGSRSQFGQEIGRFQAVRHLLAWAGVDCAAVVAVAHQAVEHDRRLPSNYDLVLKALAGRNGRRACERTLQVLGAIGFTAEHDHHHFHRRILVLDSLLGSSLALAQQLARAAREDPVAHPVLSLAALTAPGGS